MPSAKEVLRLQEDANKKKNWKRWGPYLADRQWGTVREDYSPDGNCWDYFPHDHARSRVYRWGEDGLLGLSDRECRLCFGLALWNEKDPILKERLFGLNAHEGNHGEDVKECYYYLDATPTHSYLKALYKYPQAEFPYAKLVSENKSRGKAAPEFELIDSGIFDAGRYFDVIVEYAKNTPEDILIRVTVYNRSTEAAPLHLLPTVWFRNSWCWGRTSEGYGKKPAITAVNSGCIALTHDTLGNYLFAADGSAHSPQFLFTENETNMRRIFNAESSTPFVKDGFHEYVIGQNHAAASLQALGTKACAHYKLLVPASGSMEIKLRLAASVEASAKAFDKSFDKIFAARQQEANEFYEEIIPASCSDAEKAVTRQAYAGLIWTKQFYAYSTREWLEGDPTQPAPAATRKRNADWPHLYNRDIISMPDKWEYPWYAAWDLAFHMISFCRIDPVFAKKQLILLLREWYMHPNGQIPAYEFAFGDVNPPVHAWACWRVYKMTAESGKRDRDFLARVFQKLLLNFTWWVNQKDLHGKNLFSGGFLGLDNIGVFDRGQQPPGGGFLVQADATAWMAFYCGTMLSMALELATEDPTYEDLATKFFEHFIAITEAINKIDGGLWDDRDGFYYDQIQKDKETTPLRIRSLVGILPLIAVEMLDDQYLEGHPNFRKRALWLHKNRKDLTEFISYMELSNTPGKGLRLLAIPSRERLERMLKIICDETEFLSPHGIRSLSKAHVASPFRFLHNKEELSVSYDPGESTTKYFGGNSNWRGPIWFPINFLIIEALEKYHHFYGDSFKMNYPTGSGEMKNLKEIARDLSARLSAIFLPDAGGARPCHGEDRRYAEDPHWKDLILFHEFFHGDSGKGLGASHQTGWTALVTRCLEKVR